MWWGISESDFKPKQLNRNDLLINLAIWALPGFVSFVFFGYLKVKGINYFNYILKALNEGVSVYLWNVMGTIGLIFLGIAIIFIKERVSQGILKQSNNILLNTFKAGLLAFGVLAGKAFIILLYDFHPHIWWQKWFFGIMLPIMLLAVLIINSFLWYISILIYNPNMPNQKTSIMEKIESIPALYRVSFSTIFLIVLPIVITIIKR